MGAHHVGGSAESFVREIMLRLDEPTKAKVVGGDWGQLTWEQRRARLAQHGITEPLQVTAA